MQHARPDRRSGARSRGGARDRRGRSATSHAASAAGEGADALGGRRDQRAEGLEEERLPLQGLLLGVLDAIGEIVEGVVGVALAAGHRLLAAPARFGTLARWLLVTSM
jgi:hypothetical protein